MKTRIFTFALLLLAGGSLFGQTLNELVVPKFFGSKSAGSANNTRTPFAVCLQINGLVPNTVYDIRAGIALASDPPTTFGAGNIWDGNSFSTSRLSAAFTTDISGNSGPFWIFLQPTGNSARFDAGQVHNIRIGYAVTGGTIPSVPAFTGTKLLTALDIAVNQRTSSSADDGAFIKGTALPQVSGKYVLLYDNAAGTGDPVFSYQVRQAVPVQASGQSDLPGTIADIYAQSGSSGVGDHPAVIPTGTNNPLGIRRVEARNADNTVYAFNTDDDGTWPSGGNTAGAVRREVVILTSVDAPLVPQGPAAPVVQTDSVVYAIAFDSAVSGGTVTSSGGDTILFRGLCWSFGPGASLSDTFCTVPGDTGMFTAAMTGLLPDTLYYYRAYAANSADTSYGAGYTFRTPCEPMVPVSGFWAEDTAIYVGDSVSFFDSTIHCPDTWNWSFVGGIPMSSTMPNPTGIVFNYPGRYNICLTTSNASGTHTLCRHGYISVTEPVIPKIVITEIMYNPPESGTDSLEFIELYNNDTVTVNLLDFAFTEGVAYTFPDMDIAPGGYVVVCKNDSAIYRTFGADALKWTSGSLTNSGELILLKDAFGNTVDSVSYDSGSPWDPLCNGHGYSLELCDAELDNSLGVNWRHALGYSAVNADGDTIWAHPGTGCLFPPVASFSVNDSSIMEGDSVRFTCLATGGPLAWEWGFDGGEPSTFMGETPPAVHYPQPGSYDVTLKVSNLAGENQLVKAGFIEVGEYTVIRKGSAHFRLYPNPSFGGVFKIEFGSEGPHEVSICSVTGKAMATFDVCREPSLIIRCGLPPALYFIIVRNSSDGTFGVQKLVIR